MTGGRAEGKIRWEEPQITDWFSESVDKAKEDSLSLSRTVEEPHVLREWAGSIDPLCSDTIETHLGKAWPEHKCHRRCREVTARALTSRADCSRRREWCISMASTVGMPRVILLRVERLCVCVLCK